MSPALRRYAIAVAAILSCVVREAKADFTSGNQLWDACAADEQKEPVKAIFCTSYILGAGETFQVLQVAEQVRFYCVPPKIETVHALQRLASKGDLMVRGMTEQATMAALFDKSAQATSVPDLKGALGTSGAVTLVGHGGGGGGGGGGHGGGGGGGHGGGDGGGHGGGGHYGNGAR